MGCGKMGVPWSRAEEDGADGNLSSAHRAKMDRVCIKTDSFLLLSEIKCLKSETFPSNMAAKPLSPAQTGSHPGASNCWVATREWKVVFVHDKKSYASTKLGYAGSEEGKILRLRIILIYIL